MTKFGDIRYKWLNERGFNVLADSHQYAYTQSLWSPVDIVHAVFCNSPAGTGKTTLATLTGAYELEKGTYERLIYIRNAVSVREMGYLPGSEEEKSYPFFEPFISSLDLVNPGMYEVLKAQKQVYARTSTFLRGLTFDNAFVIIDEAQNMSMHEVKTIFSRISDSSKVVVIGHNGQVDNQKLERIKGLTPFEVYMKHYKRLNYPATYHKLETNYRGKFSLLADQIDDTIEVLENE